MEALVLPGKVCRPADFEIAKGIVDEAQSLCEILHLFFSNELRQLTFINMPDEDEERLLGLFGFETDSEAFFSIPKHVAVRGTTLFDPAKGLANYADLPTVGIDPAWLAERDRDFQIAPWSAGDEIAMRVDPRCVEGLILSYAFSRYGKAVISPDRILSSGSRRRRSLRLELTHLGDEDRPGIAETVWLDRKELAKHLRKKSADRDSLGPIERPDV
ncbi:MAG: hypothetical protein RL417_1022 [Pseudomonadota bacterium]